MHPLAVGEKADMHPFAVGGQGGLMLKQPYQGTLQCYLQYVR